MLKEALRPRDFRGALLTVFGSLVTFVPVLVRKAFGFPGRAVPALMALAGIEMTMSNRHANALLQSIAEEGSGLWASAPLC